MRNKVSILLGLVAGLTVFFCTPARAEHHRATHLGNPATRFAPPLHSADELRARFAGPKLQADMADVLSQWGWAGNDSDLFNAAATADITETEIPVGSELPFMSSREHGKPVCLRNVTWAGKQPAPAYAFNFTSNGRNYRCVTPKACSNFYLEDLGAAPMAALALGCDVPARFPATRPVNVCLTVSNTGDDSESNTIVTLAIPAGATATNVSDNGSVTATSVTWQVAGLAPGTGKQVCAGFSAPAGDLVFNSTATGAGGENAQSSCGTTLFPVHAIFVELVDLTDPVEVGREVTYVITLTNQGDSPDTNLRVTATIPDSQIFVRASGDSAVQVADKTLTMEPLPSLDVKAVATWRVSTLALRPDDSRFKIEVTGDQFPTPIDREESTQLY